MVPGLSVFAILMHCLGFGWTVLPAGGQIAAWHALNTGTAPLLQTLAADLICLMACCAGGDAFLSICMWEMGYAPTTPGDAFHQPELRGFDGLNEDRMGLVDMLNRAVEGTCSQRWCHVSAGRIARVAIDTL